MKKFTESIKQIDLFEDEETLRDILLEYSDVGIKWNISYKLFRIMNDGEGEYFYPVESSNNKDLLIRHKNIVYSSVRSYHILFVELFDVILANNKQRGDNRRNFAIPNDNLYKFFEITKDIQDRIESMGYTFLLSVSHNAEFDILIIEKKNYHE